MRFLRHPSSVIFRSLASLAVALSVHAETIDLPTVLRLAGAQNLDVQLATEKLNEARANEAGTLWQFFPWITPGVGYAAHDGRLQDVIGNVFDVHKQSYTVGPAVIARLDIGDAIYKRLAAKQFTRAAAAGVEAQKQISTLAAVESYLDLVKAHAAAGIARESIGISRDYLGQISNAVTAGIAFKGDALRSQTQVHRNELLLKQAEERARIAAAQLAQILHLDSTVALVPRGDDAVPVHLPVADEKLDRLLGSALAQRPELKQNSALTEAARAGVRGAKYGPLIPTLGAQAVAGGLGGGPGGSTGNFGGSEDYQITLGWRIGPGGLFDRPRIRAAESRAKQAELAEAKTRDEVIRQVAENRDRIRLLRDEVKIAKDSVAAALETMKLTRERKEFAVGAVLETLQSEEDVTRTKLEYINAVMELNRAQYRLKAAVGQ